MDLAALKAAMKALRESGLTSEMAKVFARTVADLEAEGFTRNEALRIALSDKFQVTPT